MPKVEKVSGGQHDLRITRRARRQISENRWSSSSLRVKCGCCNEAVVIYPTPHITHINADTIEINGVSGSIAQWRQVLAPLLGFQETHSSVEQGRVIWRSMV